MHLEQVVNALFSYWVITGLHLHVKKSSFVTFV